MYTLVLKDTMWRVNLVGVLSLYITTIYHANNTSRGYLVYDNEMIMHTSTCLHTEIMGSTNCQVTAGHPLTQQCAKASQSESDF